LLSEPLYSRKQTALNLSIVIVSSGIVEIPPLQAKREFVMPVLRQTQDKLQPASRFELKINEPGFRLRGNDG
jgi:hypothetical protein